MTPKTIARILLAGDSTESAKHLIEASVKLPRRGHRWLAVYTGVEPGKQVWRSTGLTDRDAALAQAREWEADAKRQRAALGLEPRKPNIRVRRTRTGPSGALAPGVGPLSQLEVAALLGLSAKAVRSIERTALERKFH